MQMKVYIFLIATFLTTTFNALSQKVTVSNEINVRNNYAYDVLPNVGNHIIFYHDKGFEQNFEIFDDKLRYKSARQLEFEKKNINPIGVLPKDSTFNFYYTYKDEGNVHIRVNKYDKYVYLVDSATLLVKSKRLLEGTPRFAFSEDKSKVLIFTPEDKNLSLQLVNNDDLTSSYEFVLSVKDFNFRTDFEKMVVANNGDLYILGRKSSFWSTKDDKSYTLIRVQNANAITVHTFTPETDDITELFIDFDEKNLKLVMAGFTSIGDENSTNGYFGFSINANELPEEAEILINKFTMEFMADITGKKPGKVKELSFFKIQDVIVKNDGGVIIISEVTKEFVRRSQLNSPGQFGNYLPPRGYIDFYHEDLLLLSTFADGKEQWKKLLFKKQFSQDDDGIYSSYFLFKTPSRLRLVYNDEIKNNNTVSEYVLDPLGNAERKSVLSTEYQNLKLRFKDAIQIGPKSLIVPSEKSWKINLVRIDYE